LLPELGSDSWWKTRGLGDLLSFGFIEWYLFLRDKPFPDPSLSPPGSVLSLGGCNEGVACLVQDDKIGLAV